MPAQRDSAPVFGREDELRTIDALLADAARGHGTSAVVEGEPGIGKTRLLDEATGRAEARGFGVLRAAARHFERERPFGAISEALGLNSNRLDAKRARIADMLEMHGEHASAVPLELPEPALRFRLVDAILDVVEDVSSVDPLLLIVDDLQWADPSSLLVLHHLARRLDVRPVALIVACRPVPRSADVDRLLEEIREHGGVHLLLDPLPGDAVASLASHVLGAAPGDGLRSELERAAGNPLFVAELVAALNREGALEVAAGRAELTKPVLPPSLRLLILRRLSGLGEPTLQVLRLASVLGSAFPLEDLATVLGRQPADLLDAVMDATSAGVLTTSGDRLSFRHDVVREAIYDDLPPSVRVGLHRQCGRALAAVGASAASVATQMALGASPGDEEAIHWLVTAARDAAPRDPAVAADLFERALQLAGAQHRDRDSIIAEFVPALAWSGRLENAEREAGAVLARDHDPSVDMPIRLGLAQALLIQGRATEAVDVLEAALSNTELRVDERARVSAEASVARLLGGDLDGAAAMGGEALTLGEAASDDLAACIALSVLSWATNFRWNVQEARRLAERAVATAERSRSDESLRRHPHFFLGVVLWDLDLDLARDTLTRGRGLAEEMGTAWVLPLYHWAMGQTHFHAGEWDDAVAEIEAGLRLAEDIGTRVGGVWPNSVLAHIGIHRGELAAAEEALEAAERQIGVSGLQFGIDWMLWARARLLEARGDLDEAAASLEGAWEIQRSLGFCSELGMIGPDLIRLANAADRRELATSVAEAVEEAARVAAVPLATAEALRCRGLAEDDPDALLRSVESYAPAQRPVERAGACEDAGSVLARHGRREEAQELLAEGLRIYESVRAARDAARVDALLQTLGTGPRRRPRRERPRSGWESLTESERRVVDLLGQGLRNREIAERLYVSPRTVESHLYHVFAKLGVSSRLELAAVARAGGSSEREPA